MPTTLPDPWFSFLKELDEIAGETTVVPCFGGFAVTQHYGLSRTTVDIDVLDVAPIAVRNRLIEAGGKGSPLSRKYKVYLDFVGIVQAPYNYEDRLSPIYENLFKHLYLKVMDPYDIALCKLKRDSDRDFQDVLYLARNTPFDLDLFERRYIDELKPYLFGDKTEADRSLKHWLESIQEDRHSEFR